MIASEQVEQALGSILVFSFLYGCVVCLCLIALRWARDSKVQALAKILKLSAKTALIGMAAIYGVTAIAAATCSGNALYGFGNCTWTTIQFANLSAQIALICTVYGLLYTVLLFSFGAFFESRATRK